MVCSTNTKPYDSRALFGLGSTQTPNRHSCVPARRVSVSSSINTCATAKRQVEHKRETDLAENAILAIYDAMTESIRTGHPYQTRLGPPPGPPVEPLPEWNSGQPRPPNWPPHIHPPKTRRT